MIATRFDRFCAYTGPVAISLFFVGFALAGFIPPPQPSLTPAEVATFYQTHTVGLRCGMLLVMAAGMLIAPFTGAISVQVRRIPGLSPAMSYAQICTSTTNILFFYLPAIIFLVAAFRPGRDPNTTAMLNDMGWICTVVPWPAAFMQCVVLAMATLTDPGETKVFPRWFGYFNIFVALSWLPSSALVFFYAGPFAWGGIFAFWLAGTTFGIWYFVITYVLLKAISQREREATGLA